MKICFILHTVHYKYEVYPNPAVALLDSAAKLTESDTCLLYISEIDTLQHFRSKIQEINPDIVAFCCVYECTLPLIKQLAFLVKGRTVIAGGPCFSFIDINSLHEMPFDTIFIGNSESVFFEWLKAGCPKQKIIYSKQEFMDVIPNYKLFLSDLSKYENRVAAEFSRGCNNHCSFCNNYISYGHSYFRKSGDQLKAEIEYYSLNFSHICFVDLSINHTLLDLEIISSIMESFPVTYGGMLQVMDLSKDFIFYLKKSGLTDVFIGVETFSNDMADKIGKRRYCSNIPAMIYSLADAGINVSIGIIVADNEYQSESDFRNDLLILKSISKYLYNINISPLWMPGKNVCQGINRAHIMKKELPINKLTFPDYILQESENAIK